MKEKIIYINLDFRKDKNMWMQTQLSSLQPVIEFERFPAIYPGLYDADNNKVEKQWKYYNDDIVNSEYKNIGPFAQGWFGCYQSWKQVITKLHDDPKYKQYTYITILEDDCIIGTEYITYRNKIIKKLPDTWNIIRPLHLNDPIMKGNEIYKFTDPGFKSKYGKDTDNKYNHGTHCITINMRNIHDLKIWFEKEWSMAFDHMCCTNLIDSYIIGVETDVCPVQMVEFESDINENARKLKIKQHTKLKQFR